ncbi:MAG: hypothetical protein M3220_06885 [Chloroflexota bacterium]|nr:hypothetical protein [Chloroflexota bacterium]
MDRTGATQRIRTRAILRHGLVAGLLSGMLFSVAASAAAILRGQSWMAPLRLVAAVVLGEEAFQDTYPLTPLFLWGMLLHLLYTVLTGILFAWWVATQPRLRTSGAATFGVALLYTLILWLSGFCLLAPLFGWHWFAERTRFLPQFVLQVLVWGGSLGAYLALPQVRAALVDNQADGISIR